MLWVALAVNHADLGPMQTRLVCRHDCNVLLERYMPTGALIFVTHATTCILVAPGTPVALCAGKCLQSWILPMNVPIQDYLRISLLRGSQFKVKPMMNVLELVLPLSGQ